MRAMRTILLATDYLAASKEALPVAANLAKAFDAKVSVLHVISNSSNSPWMMPIRKQLSEHSQVAYLDELASHQVQRGESSIKFGVPAMQIVAEANKLDADLIVMGAGERSSDGQFIAGPVTESVMQHARQPVLAVCPGQNLKQIRKILCPIDFSPVSKRGLFNAIRLAQKFQSELVVLSVIPELNWLTAAAETGVLVGAQKQYSLEWKAELERFLERIDFADARWSQDLRLGTPAKQIIEAAQEHQADLIVMGATGLSGLARVLLGSITRRVLENLPCSILTVQDEDLFSDEPDEDSLRMGRLLFAEAQELVAAKSYEATLAKLDQLLAHNPYHAPALELRAEICEHLGQNERAQRCRRRAEVLRQSVRV